MTEDRRATLYYGYELDSNGENAVEIEDIDKINDELNITAKKIGRKDEDSPIVIGRKIEEAEKGEAEKITASELLNYLTSISKTRELDKTLEKLDLENRDPKLILCSEL